MRPRPVVLTALVVLTATTEVVTMDVTTPAITTAQAMTVTYNKRFKSLKHEED
jgi:hypothetical protein